jgi:hypothetical protein
MARLHIYPHSEPRQDLHILADPPALRALANALMRAAQSATGYERVKLHTADGHEYYAMIVADVAEDEWQGMPVPYQNSTVPDIRSLEDYHSVRLELLQLRRAASN